MTIHNTASVVEHKKATLTFGFLEPKCIINWKNTDHLVNYT